MVALPTVMYVELFGEYHDYRYATRANTKYLRYWGVTRPLWFTVKSRRVSSLGSSRHGGATAIKNLASR